MRTAITFSFFLLLMMPSGVSAAVIINEIAWMGDALSVNHEWIELYNDGGTDVSLDGWVVRDGLNLEISLSGSIPSNAYAVLERTSEESAAGQAFLIYTGALVNTGATLTLYNASGEITDQVAGGENWADVGGDNTTKETAQYTSGGWVTDEATPGALNKTGREETVVEDSPESVGDVTNSSSVIMAKTDNRNKTVRLMTLDTELQLKLDFQTLAYVNQPVHFSVLGSGIGENIINSLNYTWNFGDTNTASGKKATHTFAYPGTYVVTMRANYARHNQVARQEITILPVTFSITKNLAGDVQIHNDAPYDVELSGFTIKGGLDFVFPPDTIMIPRGTITIKANKLGLHKKDESVTLFDQEKTLVASTVGLSALPENMVEATVAAKVISYRSPEVVEMASVETSNLRPEVTTFSFVKPTTEPLLVAGTGHEIKDITEGLVGLSAPEAWAKEDEFISSEENTSQPVENSWAYLALIGLLFLGLVGLLSRPNISS